MPPSVSRSRCILPLCGAAWIATAVAHAAPVDPQGDFAARPRGSYVPVDAPVLATPREAHGGSPHVLFLNRCTGGETINPGWDDSSTNHSSILGGSVSFPEYPYGDGSWSVVLEQTRELFAPYNIQVTDVDPAPSPHDEVIVCGTGAQAGFGGAGGVAPFSCGIIPNAITFVFAETMGNNPEAIAIVIGQEAAHAWGLDHEYKCDDPMTYLNWCGDVSFQDGDYPCGEYQERACSCGGNTQNSHQMILQAFGPGVPDTQTPLASITSPSDGATYEPGANFEIAVDVSDDIEVTSVTLFVNGESQGSDDTAPFGPWPAQDTPAGTYEFYVEARDFAGNVGTSNMVSVDVGMAAGGDAGTGGGGDSGGGDSAGEGTDGGSDPGAGGSDDGFVEGDGALPPGFGANRDAGETCACTTTPAGASVVLPWILALGLRRRARRQREFV